MTQWKHIQEKDNDANSFLVNKQPIQVSEAILNADIHVSDKLFMYLYSRSNMSN